MSLNILGSAAMLSALARCTASRSAGRMAIGASLVISVLGLVSAGQGYAQDYPRRPIKIITPFASGGGTDVVARIVAEKMSANLGQPVIVENRVGAGGAIAMDAVAKADPDGYTVGFTSSSALVVLPLTKPALTYQRELVPVSHICNVPLILVARGSLPVETVRDLVALAKSSPGKLTVGSSGIGSSPHVMGENFNNLAGIRLLHVPYKGDAQEVAAMLGGELDTAFMATASVTSLIESGKLKGLAIVGTKRAPDLPKVPTFAEVGYPESSIDTFYGLVITARTPNAIVSRLAAAAAAAVATSEVQDRIRRLNLIPVGAGPEPFSKVIKQNSDTWSKVISKMDLKELSQ